MFKALLSFATTMDRSSIITSSAEPKPEDHPMPKHWKIGYKEGEGFSFSNVMLFIGVGKRTSEEFWESTYPEDRFEKGRGEITKRITHINLVVSEEVLPASGRGRGVDSFVIARPEQAGLLLTTIATFCTTDPPANSTLLPYTRGATYTLLLVSLALSLGGLIVGSSIAFTFARCTSEELHGVRIWPDIFFLLLRC